MKYILVALITISFAFGQGTINTDTDSKCGKIIDGIFYEEECFTPTRERVITFGDILEYAEECYNDSTEDCYIRVLDSAEIIYYRHPTPTFEGFIEWYERRIK